MKTVEMLLIHDLGRTDSDQVCKFIFNLSRVIYTIGQERPECSICLEILTRDNDCTALECDHTFHTACIKVFCGIKVSNAIISTVQNWMQKKKTGNTCPNCRSFAP